MWLLWAIKSNHIHIKPHLKQPGPMQGHSLPTTFNIPYSEHCIWGLSTAILSKCFLQGISKRWTPKLCEIGWKSCVLFTFCRHGNATFSSRFHTTWGPPFRDSLYNTKCIITESLSTWQRIWWNLKSMITILAVLPRQLYDRQGHYVKVNPLPTSRSVKLSS